MGLKEDEIENYSILMSVYGREKPENLAESMESMRRQTLPSDDFVLVCDGPLNEGLDRVIDEMQRRFGPALRVFRLPENLGLGRALRYGIEKCRHELVARMDSDDISRPERCREQLRVFREHPELSIVSAVVEEFTDDISAVSRSRCLPETAEEIRVFARKRNPFNHPCVMFRRSAVLAAGSYQDFYLLEDYYLWVRMLLRGAEAYNLQKPLLWMRAGSEMYNRRSGRRYARSQQALFRFMYDSGFITGREYLAHSFVRTVSSLIPNRLRAFGYSVFLRH